MSLSVEANITFRVTPRRGRKYEALVRSKFSDSVDKASVGS